MKNLMNFLIYLAGLILIYLLFMTISELFSYCEFYSTVVLEIIWSIIYSRILLRKYLIKKFAYMPFVFLLILTILIIIFDIIFKLCTGEFGAIYIVFLIPPAIIGIVFTAIFGEKIIKNKRGDQKNV